MSSSRARKRARKRRARKDPNAHARELGFRAGQVVRPKDMGDFAFRKLELDALKHLHGAGQSACGCSLVDLLSDEWATIRRPGGA